MQNSDVDYLLSQNIPPIRQRRQRTNFNDKAIELLEQAFAKDPYPDINERESMALKLSTTEDRIQVWFQNKRARYRKKMHKKENRNGSASHSPSRVQPQLHSTPQIVKQQMREENECKNDSGYGSILTDSSVNLNHSYVPMSPLMSSSIVAYPNSYLSPQYFAPPMSLLTQARSNLAHAQASRPHRPIIFRPFDCD